MGFPNLLATKVSGRRIELGLDVAEAARQAGISRKTWTTIEKGEERDLLGARVGARVDAVLGWRPGTAVGVFAQGHGFTIELNDGQISVLDLEREMLKYDEDWDPANADDVRAFMLKRHLAAHDRRQMQDVEPWPDSGRQVFVSHAHDDDVARTHQLLHWASAIQVVTNKKLMAAVSSPAFDELSREAYKRAELVALFDGLDDEQRQAAMAVLRAMQPGVS